MSRLFLDRARGWTALFVTLTIVGMSPTTALAGAAAPRPVVDSRPRAVGFKHDAVVTGHVGGSRTADEVVVQKKDPSGTWNTLVTGHPDSGGLVRFRLANLHRTGAYRLVWRDSGSDATSRSDLFTIKVRPRLVLRATPDDVLIGRDVRVSGRLYPAAPGRKVFLQRRAHGHWRFLRTLKAGDGTFGATLAGRAVGHHGLRVTFSGDRLNTKKRSRDGYNVYDPDQATWYGPGFYGQRTACGRTLSQETLGVANRTLPCGTDVSILYRGRTITVPVIDRGPYSSAEWDLTSATARKLGFEGSNTIGVRH
jgi:hypothetical protein